jgi:hypothetical protein
MDDTFIVTVSQHCQYDDEARDQPAKSVKIVLHCTLPGMSVLSGMTQQPDVPHVTLRQRLANGVAATSLDFDSPDGANVERYPSGGTRPRCWRKLR